MEEKKPHYKRILVKLSGEALSAGDKGILNYDFLEEIGHVIKTCGNAGQHRCRRGQHLERQTRCQYGSHTRRPYGYACNRHQLPCITGYV